MILNTTKEAEALPSLRKAAILLVALGEASSAQLLQQLNKKAEVFAKHLREKIAKEPDISVQILRTWIREEEN